MKALLLKAWDESIYENEGYDENLHNYLPVTLLGYDRDKRFLFSNADGVTDEFKTGFFRKDGLRHITKRDMAKLPRFNLMNGDLKPVTRLKSEAELKQNRKIRTSYSVISGDKKSEYKSLASAMRKFNSIDNGYVERYQESGSLSSWSAIAEKKNDSMTVFVDRNGKCLCSPRHFK